MSKLTLLTPIITAISALALFINSSFFEEENKKRVTGKVVRSVEGQLVLLQGEKTLTFAMTSDTPLYLNDRKLQQNEIPEGRTATVTYTQNKKVLLARHVDVFPVPGDVA